jgi:hypothetical protein
MYCVKFLDRLRGKLGFFTEGNEGSEEFLQTGLECFTEGVERKEEGGHSNRTDFGWSESDKRRKQRCLTLDFGQNLVLAKHNLCSLRYLLFK